uniref:Dehydrogenase/reductase SDR family member 11 n=1 Tax=Timema monikensis TaxID=170555 RepID=A0A7R9E717_9NEOP|nr:unnamed protein product [Timema monikensis]
MSLEDQLEETVQEHSVLHNTNYTVNSSLFTVAHIRISPVMSSKVKSSPVAVAPYIYSNDLLSVYDYAQNLFQLTVDNLRNAPGTLYPLECDLTKEEDILATFDWIKRNLGGVDILVNNAGSGDYQTLLGSSSSSVTRSSCTEVPRHLSQGATVQKFLVICHKELLYRSSSSSVTRSSCTEVPRHLYKELLYRSSSSSVTRSYCTEVPRHLSQGAAVQKFFVICIKSYFTEVPRHLSQGAAVQKFFVICIKSYCTEVPTSSVTRSCCTEVPRHLYKELLYRNGKTEGWEKQIDLGIIGVSICTREAIKSMRERQVDDGHIININSVAGHAISGVPLLIMNSAIKHGLTVLTEGLRRELVASDSKIRVTSISPGLVRTEATLALEEHLGDTLIKDNPQLAPKDIADAILFCLGAPAHVQIHELTIRPAGEKF